jgi:L-iditol 2-dehydrogenase
VQTVQIERTWSDIETAAAISAAVDGGKVRVALECTGFEGSIRAAIFVSWRGDEAEVWGRRR